MQRRIPKERNKGRNRACSDIRSPSPMCCIAVWDLSNIWRGLRRGSASSRFPGMRVRIPPWAWMSVSCECCVLSGRGLCDGPIPRPEGSYRLGVWHRFCSRSTVALNLQWVGRRERGNINVTAIYRGADKSLARPPSQCILFDG